MSSSSSTLSLAASPSGSWRSPWILVDLAIVLAFLNPLVAPEHSIIAFVTLFGVVNMLFAIHGAGVSTWRSTLRWLGVPALATFAFQQVPSAPLALLLPILGIATGIGMAYTIGKAMVGQAPDSAPSHASRWLVLGAAAFLGYAASGAATDGPARSRTGWVEPTGYVPAAQPAEFERTEKLRLGPTNALHIPGSFAGCEVEVRVITAWNASFEVAFARTPGLPRTSFFIGTDPRIKTGFARRTDPDSAVETIGVAGWARQPYQRLDVILRRVDGRLTAFVIDRTDSPESQAKQEANAIAFADEDTGRPCSLSLLAAKGVFDVERVSVRPLENRITVVDPPWTWRSRSVILPLALLILVLAVAFACRDAKLRCAVEGFSFAPLAAFLGTRFLPAPESLLVLTWRSMHLGILVALLAALPFVIGMRRSVVPALSAALGGILALGAFAYAPQLVDGRSQVRFGTLHDWRGRSYEPDLAFLRHPTIRGENRYYEDHTFHGEVASPLRTSDVKRIVIVGDDSWLARSRNEPAPIAVQLDVFLSAYAKAGADGPIREIESLDATAGGRESSNLPALMFCERTLLVRANPPEDATGKPWRGPDVEALAPDVIVFLVSSHEMPRGSLELLEAQVGPQGLRNWLDELREELDLGQMNQDERLRQLVKPLIRLAGTVSTAQAATGRPCRLLFVLPPRAADSGALPFLNSFGLFQVLAPVLPSAVGEGKPCFAKGGELTEAGQRLLARMLALLLAPQFAPGGAR